MQNQIVIAIYLNMLNILGS